MYAKTLLLPKLLLTRNSFPEVISKLKSRKFPFNHRFTVILMPSILNYEKMKSFHLYSLMLTFSFGIPYQKQQLAVKLTNGLNCVLILNIPRKDSSKY